MTVMAPADENECRQMLYTAFTLDTPAAVRYPRGAGPGVAIAAEMTALPIGKGEIRRTSSRRDEPHRDPRVRRMLRQRSPRRDELDATVANMRFVKPLDADARREARARARRARHRRGKRRDGRRGQRGRRGARRRRHRRSRSCSWGCPTRSSITAIRRSSSPNAGSTPRASRTPLPRRFGAPQPEAVRKPAA